MNEQLKTSEGKEFAPASPPPLLVFGQGPVIDKVTRDKPTEATLPGTEDINLWSDDLAKAAAILVKTGEVSQIVVMGGPTGGETFQPEAVLIKQRMEEYGVPDSDVRTENNSRDTLENIINMVNMRKDQGQSLESFNILGADFHMARIHLLMQLFNLPVKHEFSAESVLMLAARIKEGTQSVEGIKELERVTKLNPDLLNNMYLPSFQQLVNMTNLNTSDFFREYRGATGSEFVEKTGTETRDFSYRRIKDDIWTRELLEMPESWLGTVTKINDPVLRKSIVRHADKIYAGILNKKFGIDIENETDESLLEKLSAIKKIPLTSEEIKQWEIENLIPGWPKEVSDRLELLLDERG